MKRIVAMMSKGKDVSSLFPEVIKNVVCSSLEVKKLVYMYLIHYAETKQDEAIMVVNTFQKDLVNHNQFIRALALRVMTSIRVRLITQILLMSVKKASTDVSPYVRKAAALAVPKICALDHDTKDELKEVIAKLLEDHNTLVLGSAVFAFSEVCPDSWDLLHAHYRKLCRLTVDADEWGQVVIMNTLLRYARAHFLSPFHEEMKEHTENGVSNSQQQKQQQDEEYVFNSFDLDPDHRLLLRSMYPLLKNRNSAVVLAVASLYFHTAPTSETPKVVKSLIRICRGHPENQYIALANIATMAKARPEMFRDYLKEFFITSSDTSYCRDLKLEIISLLVTPQNIHSVLREFRSYTKHEDKQFVMATIQALGRVAAALPDITETVVHKLMALIAVSKSDIVIGESVTVIRTLIQLSASRAAAAAAATNDDESTSAATIDNPGKLIAHLAYMLDRITVPMARASIVWLVGEFYDEVSNIAADILRIMAKNFANEDDHVKMQVITLGTKVYLKEGERVSLLYQYILNLGKYDTSYDIRDRVRFIRRILITPENQSPLVREHAAEIFLALKSVPIFETTFQDRSRFALGSLSHIVNHTAFGYTPIPDFPEVVPDPSVRNVAGSAVGSGRSALDEVLGTNRSAAATSKPKKPIPEDLDRFYDQEDEEETYSSLQNEDEEDEDDEEEEEEEDEEEEEEEDDEEDDDEEEEEEEEEGDEDDDEDEDDEDDEEDDEDEEDEEEEEDQKQAKSDQWLLNI